MHGGNSKIAMLELIECTCLPLISTDYLLYLQLYQLKVIRRYDLNFAKRHANSILRVTIIFFVNVDLVSFVSDSNRINIVTY